MAPGVPSEDLPHRIAAAPALDSDRAGVALSLRYGAGNGSATEAALVEAEDQRINRHGPS